MHLAYGALNRLASTSMEPMPARYELRLLDYVIAIAEEGSLSAASRRLRLSQPTLSRQLGNLEQRLGASLFDRTGHGLTPTAAGMALVRRARRVLAEADAISDDVWLAANGKTGRLTITFAGSGINGALGALLGRLRVELPDVDLELVEVFDDLKMSAGVLEGAFDIAVQRLPLRDSRLHRREWTREPLTLFLPANHPLARSRDPVPVTELADLPLVLWPRAASPRAYDEIIVLYHQIGAPPRIVTEAQTVQTILTLVAAGFGTTIMADSYRVLHRDGVVARPILGTATSLSFVWRAGDTSPLLARFFDVVDGTNPVDGGGSAVVTNAASPG
ncbi:LysR family transcriptional regulator [Prauserella endophytica]|uniref:LysR family transcriptional regulator n=1 Tax=Prauserella endophytica TaxID=1592324 RepID=A0ABY2RWN7_9PSEU|nr:LysR family transcriptional regulator [Prauserella endophytica]TKG61826.1 LysR family transcriptional regulator [Prauserella endophytica]